MVLRSPSLSEVHAVLKCKWSLSIISELARGPANFATLARKLGISNKVLTDKLKRLSASSLVHMLGGGVYSLSPEGYNIIETVNPLIRRGIDPIHLGEVLKCKWMREIISKLMGGPMYPSEILKANPGLSWKVLSQRLQKLVRMGFVSREIIPTSPVRVRYMLTNQGRLVALYSSFNFSL
jgi:DNA-binding HxlR family transcriptional regulator